MSTGDRADRPTILLVEDEAIIALAEQRQLQQAGYHVLVAHDGERAVTTARPPARIDLILMDIDLGPGIDGTTAAQRILAEREVPIVFLTGHGERDMVDRVKGITRYGYVLKNSGEFVLLQSIEMALELFRAHAAMEREVHTRRAAEEELRARNEYIRAIVDNLPIGLAVNRMDEGTAVYMNKSFTRIYGWPQKTLTSIASFFEHVYPEPRYRAALMTRITADLETGDPERMRWDDIEITREDGSTAIVSAMNVPIPHQNLMVSLVRDVTEHNRMTAALRESEARYRAIAENFPNGMVALVDHELRYIAAAGSELVEAGLSDEFFLGKRLSDILPPEIAARDEPALQAALNGETRRTTVEHEGRVHQVITTPVTDAAGATIAGLVMTQDVTDAVRSQERLRRALVTLELAVDSADLGIWSLDAATGRLTWNDRMGSIYGIASSEYPADPDAWRALVAEEEHELADRLFAALLGGETIAKARLRIRRPDGAIRHVRFSGRPVLVNDRIVRYVGINIDVTETENDKRELERHVEQHSLLLTEANHRIKNSLQTVRALVGFAEQSSGVDLADLRNQLATIESVHELVRVRSGQHGFSVRPHLHRVLEQFSALQRERRFTLEADIEDVSLGARYAAPLGLIANELVTNAVQHGVKREGDRVVATFARTGETCALSVANDGRAFPEEIDPDAPTTLGLQLVQALTGQIDGELTLERGKQTRFTVTFTPRG